MVIVKKIKKLIIKNRKSDFNSEKHYPPPFYVCVTDDPRD